LRRAEDASPTASVSDWDVVFFSSVDFSSHMQRAQAVARELAARGARVLFVDNLGLRFPRLGDRRRVVHRVRAALGRRREGGAGERAHGITVLSPIVPPLPGGAGQPPGGRVPGRAGGRGRGAGSAR
jgi:hypothetical protein